MNIALLVITLLLLLYSSYTDISEGRVDNYAVLGALGVALILQIFHLGFWDYVIRLVIIFAIFMCYEGFIGAGDAKLLMALTMLQGPYKSLATLGIASLGILIASAIAQPAEFKETMRNTWAAIKALNPGSLKTQGRKVKLVPFMLGGFLITLLIFGI